MIILSPTKQRVDELQILLKMLDKGLSLYHVRHYHFTVKQMSAYLDFIPDIFRDRIVLHSHFHLALDFGIQRLHLPEKDREQGTYDDYRDTFILSTSVHSMARFNALEQFWDYAFLSPVFPSISKKGYGLKHTVLAEFSQRNNWDIGLVGLGGVDHQNCIQVLQAGADDVALLGGIWEKTSPLAAFDEFLSLSQLKNEK